MTRLNYDRLADTEVMSVHGTSAGAVPPTAADQGLGGHKAQNIGEAERWGSVLGGAALLLAGLQRGRLGGLVVGLIGGSLLYRGYTGHCHAYDALGIDTAHRPPATAVRSGHGVKV